MTRLIAVGMLMLALSLPVVSDAEECLWNCPCLVGGWLWYGECIYYHYWSSPVTGVWGYFINTRVGGEVGPIGTAVDPGLLPADFVNGGILTADQLNAAMGAADYNGLAGDVPPADNSGYSVSDGYTTSDDSTGAEYE